MPNLIWFQRRVSINSQLGRYANPDASTQYHWPARFASEDHLHILKKIFECMSTVIGALRVKSPTVIRHGMITRSCEIVKHRYYILRGLPFELLDVLRKSSTVGEVDQRTLERYIIRTFHSAFFCSFFDDEIL